MGWLLLLALALAAAGLLWRFGGVRGPALQLLLAALLLAAAGYAWQGAPQLEGRPRATAARPMLPDTPFAVLRREMFGGFDRADSWLTISEGYHRRGDTAGAAGVLRSALRANPQNATLWAGYANALIVHGGGRLSPASDLAFRRSAGLAPKHPGPLLFYGAALLENGRVADAERVLRRALSLTPAKAPYREPVARQLRAIEDARRAGLIP
jgi:cytochrome c-type biogenesis protein CcmH/NrfG